MAVSKDSFLTGDDANYTLSSTYWMAQSFTPSSSYIAYSVKLKMYRGAATTGTMPVVIRATDVNGKPTGADLCSGTIDVTTITTIATPVWYEIIFTTTTTLSAGVLYAIICKGEGYVSGGNVFIRTDTGSGYSSGKQQDSTDEGVTWTQYDTFDTLFDLYASSAPANDKLYSKNLVAIGNNEAWYESSSGTMSELSAANGDIDTILPLTGIDAFQKIFIANQTYLRVMDFVNVKLTTSSLSATNPPDFGTVLTGTGGGSMIVDFCSTLTGAAYVYGKVTTTTAFISTDTVTGLDNDGNAISFTLTAPPASNPHWYTWTPFGNSSTFGTMPTSAYLVCRYRARLVLAGNPNYPHQWYMSRVANPWNWLYGTDDPLSAVAGNNADAGQVGDIIRALIPYGDDFLIFGCANSIWLLDGDPASGGSLDELSDFTGMYGPWAWCKDNDKNLYFWGTGGLYKMDGGRTRPVNISSSTNPQWVDTWATLNSTHRVTLSYDPQREGILITRTTITDGTNLSYWYDLKTQGFYPESAPAACGPYCSIYNDSDSTTYRAMLYGCKDGYIRHFKDSLKYDNATAATAIDSYLITAPFPIGDGFDNEGKIKQIVLESAGGASSGDFSDSDGFSYDVYVADDAETCIEDVKDGATANLTGSITGTGRKSRIRQNVRGQYATIKIYNSTISQTFGLNRILIEKDISGRLKDV